MTDKKISELTARVSPDGTEEIPVNFGGANFKITVADIGAFPPMGLGNPNWYPPTSTPQFIVDSVSGDDSSTGQIDCAITDGSISGTVLTVVTVDFGTISVGDNVIFLDVPLPAGLTITSFGTGTGGAGTYNLSANCGSVANIFGIWTTHHAFKTIQAALNYAASFSYQNLFYANFVITAGTYSEALVSPAVVGNRNVQFILHFPSSTTIDATGTGFSTLNSYGGESAELIVNDASVTYKGESLIFVSDGGNIAINGGIAHGTAAAAAGYSPLFTALNGSFITIIQSITVELDNPLNTGVAFIGLTNYSEMDISGITMTFSGTPDLEVFVSADRYSALRAVGTTFSGAVDAAVKKFALTNESMIETDVVLGSWPGTVAGTHDNWSHYNNIFPASGAAGNDTDVQFNSSGVLDGNDLFTYNGAGVITLGDASNMGGVYFNDGAGATVGLYLLPGATTYDFALPPDAGTNGWVLQTDGSGNTTWVAPGAASIAIGSAISGGAGLNGVLYDDGSVTLQEAANFTISGSGEGNITSGNALLYDGDPVIFAQPAQYNFFDGGAGNNTNSGSYNTGTGVAALGGLTTGAKNSGIGGYAGYGIANGSNNLCVGYFAGYGMNGSDNFALGAGTLVSDTSATSNLAIGSFNMGNGAGATNCIAIGASCLPQYSAPTDIIAIGNSCCGAGTVTGNNDIAIGRSCLISLTSGTFDIAIGNSALIACTSGGNNIALGRAALAAIVSDDFNIGIGYFAGSAINGGARNVCIGTNARRQHLFREL